MALPTAVLSLSAIRTCGLASSDGGSGEGALLMGPTHGRDIGSLARSAHAKHPFIYEVDRLHAL